MGPIPIRYIWLGLAVTAGAALLVAGPAIVQRQQVAQAEEVRQRCVSEFTAKRAWRAEITETETGSDGAASVMRQQVSVRGPGEYRLTVRERDQKGRAVVSETIRTGQTFYTRRTNADGSTELHIVRGVQPSLEIEMDNLLGQTVQSVVDSKPLRIVGRGVRNKQRADKLQIGPGRFVWVDQKTGLPIEEQVVSGGDVVHSVVVNSFDDAAPPADSDFDPGLLEPADVTTEETLGFKPVTSPISAARALGFTPVDPPAPVGFSVAVQGYVDPKMPSGDGAAEASFVTAFSDGASGVIVTQAARLGAGDSFVPADADDGSFDRIEVGGMPAALFHDAAHPRLVFVRRDVLVTIEGDLTESAMRELAESIRRQ